MGIRVIVVDDNKSMREGLRELLTGAPEIEIIGEGGSGHWAVAVARTLLPDVVVMDVVMPEMNGVEATRQIRAVDDHVRIIAVSSHSDDRYVQHMLAAGACGYVLKIAAHDDLVRAVRGARHDKVFLSRELCGCDARPAMRFDPLDEVSA